MKRQGWIDRGVANPESSADHSWAVALFAWLLALDRDDLDPNRVLLLAMVHDLPEALAGDATPFERHRGEDGAIEYRHFQRAPVYDSDESRAKHERERQALLEMTDRLPDHLAGRVLAAWEEYAARETPEARFVREVDKLETLLQAEQYLERQPEIVIDSFRAGTDRDVDDPALREVFARILPADSRDRE